MNSDIPEEFYLLGNQYKNKVIHIGVKQSYMPDDMLIV